MFAAAAFSTTVPLPDSSEISTSRLLPTTLRVDVLEGLRVGAHAGGVQAGLVREGVLADVRLRGVRARG